MIDKEQVMRLAEEITKNSAYYLVDLSISKTNQIRIEIDGDSGVHIEDCVRISRHIETNLDREVEDYELTVSSAGMDQPFKVLRQYQRYIGRKVEVKTLEGKKVVGNLVLADDEKVVVEVKTKVKKEGKKKKEEIIENKIVPMEQVKETKVVISFN